MLTIVSITKDDLEGINRTIQSVSRLKTHLSVQHLVIDSSQKDIATTIKSLCQKNKTTYVYQKPQGIAAAFNLGLTKARYKWIWFLNGGDCVHPKLDPVFLKSLLAQSKAKLIICEIETQSGTTNKGPLYSLWLPVMNWVPHPGTIADTQAIRDVRGFDTTFKIASDGDLWFKLLSKDYNTDLLSLPIATFFPGGISSNLKSTSRETLRILWRYRFLIIRRWINCIYYLIKSLKISLINGYF